MIRKVKINRRKHFKDPFMQGISDRIHLGRIDNPYRAGTQDHDRYVAGYRYAEAAATGRAPMTLIEAAEAAPGGEQADTYDSAEILRPRIDNNPWPRHITRR